MAGSEVESKVEKGNAFRDLVASMLDAAGFVAEAETRERFKKVDIRWRREDIDGPVRYVVEARSGPLGMTECREFLTEYGRLSNAAMQTAPGWCRKARSARTGAPSSMRTAAAKR
jgi:hypothetical protein